MKINKTSDTSAYIDIGSRTFYIDNSTNEGIMETWETNNPPVKFSEGGSTSFPIHPEIHYRNEGWINYADWIGTSDYPWHRRVRPPLDKETN